MSLYYDVVSVLTGADQQGSLKSRIYSNKSGLKSKPAHLYALISECAKYDTFLCEVINNSQLLEHEPKVTPLLSILLVHDHFFAKGGIAASTAHPLKQAIERHKARLQAEFTKARLRRRCGNIEDLKKVLAVGKNDILSGRSIPQPRWVRVNTLKSSLKSQLGSTFVGYGPVRHVKDVAATGTTKGYYIDGNIPDMIAVQPDSTLVKTQAYLNGEVILQDKASCFPAYLLLGDNTQSVGGVIDGCAAPGNKTTHLAAILSSAQHKSSDASHRIFACERDARRSGILQDMTSKAGAASVEVLAKQDFLALDANDQRFTEVTHLLLDPSCSGSGIIGREDVPQLSLPNDPRSKPAPAKDQKSSKKRKHESISTEEQPLEEEQPNHSTAKDPERLAKLAGLQSRIVEHALSFPAARRVTYSTCSIHHEENEDVVGRILASEVARERGWRVLRRDQQPDGMRKWPHRGTARSEGEDVEETRRPLTEEELEGCIRCYPNDEQGTMGFFVVCFVRDIDGSFGSFRSAEDTGTHANGAVDDDWDGFSD